MSQIINPAAAGGGGGPALSDTVVSEELFGLADTAGAAATASRGDHTHGSPVNPVPAHEAAADPHTGYQKESEKGAANGYASLGADSLVPQDQLGTGVQDGTKFLRDDGTWQAVGGGSTPTGTGFRHITGGVEDAAAKLVDTADINNDQVTYAKMQDVTDARLLGRSAGSAGDPQELTVSAPITLAAGVLDFDETAALGNNARVTVRKNTGVDVGTRRRLNLIEGANVTLTVADDVANEEVDVTIAAAGGGGGGGAWTAFTQDLGAARRSGTFDVTGLSGLTAGNPVEVMQTLAAIASKGNAVDEPEMDTILVTAEALDTTSFRARWFSADKSVVVGTYAFAWR